MWLVSYFLAKFGEGGGRGGKPAPPAELEVAGWADAYGLFFQALGEGRTQRTFANSLKNARDTFDSHLSVGRIGWRAGSGTGGEREPQPLTRDAEATVEGSLGPGSS
jgi:5-methylcytosine-specific restriction protein A